MNNFYVVPNSIKDKKLTLTKKIIDWLDSYGYKVFVTEEIGNHYNIENYSLAKEKILSTADCAIVLGGDGTILQTSRELAEYNLPILGVNLGNFGFLAEVEEKEVIDTLRKIHAGEYNIEERMMLEADMSINGNIINSGLALNDIVITRTALSRMVGYSVYVNNNLVNNYKADGVIISTPTGSTAYNLSAGGPLLAPNNEILVMTPICPHSLTARSIVLSGEDIVRITFESNRSSWDEDLMITIDGQEGIKINNDTSIIIRKSNLKTKLIKLNDKDFYSLLRKKLG